MCTIKNKNKLNQVQSQNINKTDYFLFTNIVNYYQILVIYSQKYYVNYVISEIL